MYIRQLIDQLEKIIEQEGHDQIEISIWAPNTKGAEKYYSNEVELMVYKYQYDIDVSLVSYK